MLSNSPGETFEPVTAIRMGWNACRGFWPSRSASPRSACLDRLGRRTARRVRSASSAAARIARVQLRRVVAVAALEEEAGVLRELAEPLDLLLHERRGRSDARPRASRSPARAGSATSASAYSSAAVARR